MRTNRESIAMSANSYMLVSLPNEQQPTDQVNNHVPVFATLMMLLLLLLLLRKANESQGSYRFFRSFLPRSVML